MKRKVTYIACDYEDGFPITTADSFENIRIALDDYCGADHRQVSEFKGFFPFKTKYGSEYEGYMEYESCQNDKDWSKTFISKFKIYCVNFSPLTKVEENASFDNPPKAQNKDGFGEISDEEIKEYTDKAFIKGLGDTSEDWFIMGAKWYKEQLKLKQPKKD